MSYAQQNAKFLLELEALFEKIGHGQIDLSLDIYNKRITASTYYGKKRLAYNKDNKKAVGDIIERLLKSSNEKKTEALTFVVTVRNGYIQQTVWQSSMKRNHEEETSTEVVQQSDNK